MNAFKKLALAAAVASVPMVGVAMEPLNDEGLSNVTGQDGITIGINLEDMNLDVYIEDTDGIAGDTTRNKAGMIAIRDLVVSTDNQPITVEVDAGSSGSGANTYGVLRLGVNVAKLEVSGNGGANEDLFSIGVAGVDVSTGEERDANAGLDRVLNDSGAAKEYVTDVMSLKGLTLSGLNMDIELGPEAQGMTIEFNGQIDEIELTDFNIGPGDKQIHLDSILVSGLDLTGTTGQVVSNGLEITMGGSQSGSQIALMGISIGDHSDTSSLPSALGNVYVDGLNLNGSTVTIAGH